MIQAYVFEKGRLRPASWESKRTLRWAAWRPNGRSCLLVGNGGTAVLLEDDALTPLETGTRQNLRGAAWSPDGRTALLVGNRGAVLALQGEAFATVDTGTVENLRRVAWHPGGEHALVLGNYGTVLRYERSAGTLTPLPGDRAHTLRSIAFRPDGAYALIGAYASRFAGYPRPHALYRCDGRYLQSLLQSDDEDDFVAVDWRADGLALAAGYATNTPERTNKALVYDGSIWQAHAWPAQRLVLGGAWRPNGEDALLAGEGGLLARLTREGGVEELATDTDDNLIGPFWRPDGSHALILKGPGENVYTV